MPARYSGILDPMAARRVCYAADRNAATQAVAGVHTPLPAAMKRFHPVNSNPDAANALPFIQFMAATRRT